MRTVLARLAALVALLAVVGLLPWLSRNDPALTVLRARSAEQEATPEALDAIRADLGLDAGPLALLGRWAAGLARGDLGTSWVSGHPVGPAVASGAGTSLTLMACALAVALLLAAALCAPTVWRGARGSLGDGRPGGAVGAILVACPEFLIATVGLIVVGVWLGWLPTSGWAGPANLVLPAVAMGVPAGAMIGRLVGDTLPGAFDERWVALWRSAGVTEGRLALGVLRRALPAVMPQFGLVVVALTGGAVAVETIFAVPGIGRTALGAAKSQDLPLLQGCVLALMCLGATAGLIGHAARRAMLGTGLRDAALSPPAPPRGPSGTRQYVVPSLLAAVLAVIVVWGLLRDPLTVDVAAKLLDPSWTHPLGTDALGRDVLARLGHGAANTVGAAVAVCAFGFALSLGLGFAPRVSAGVADIANAVPAVLAGVLVAAALGPGTAGATIAVAAVSWPNLTAHAAALTQEARAASYLTAQRALGASPAWITVRHVLPEITGPLARHAVLKLPGTALAIASLGFLGLGTQPPTPEWGLLLNESRSYVEVAPAAALAPAAAIAFLAALTVSSANLTRLPKRTAVNA
ncbi:ABC transporter permease subunit [Glycomyces sp. TRM65418]|uniref:ABC transporter permease subunit n=1 Tax=Glycomyces sp. TRM65418 TaxID=2867006 RepID=UPI001CE63E60|nr:ABC transporter permease subunit [Glycomyces sp. TRM65418]MCC3763109.1 ABC transporter permease subunit [Glycomyces sp. TRM65418]QZD57117.1 ABC transporter permease subunit [Glycomyces sp. TRM65418]